MVRGFLIALAAVLCSCKAEPPPDRTAATAKQPPPLIVPAKPSQYLIDGDTIPRIICPEGPDLAASGTGVRINATDVVTALHVVERLVCFVDGKFSLTVMRRPDLDFAVLRTVPEPVRVTYSCDAPKPGELLFVAGYADSARHPRIMPLVYTGEAVDGLAVFYGKVMHGHSGGPVSDLDGIVYGIALQKLDPEEVDGETFARAGVLLFRDTPLCS
jgi:hypothetical protein